jgi:hypothetical protein
MNYDEMSKEDIKTANDNLVAVIEQLLSTKLTDDSTVESKNCQSKCFVEYNQCIANGSGVLVCSANLRGCIAGCP